MSWATRIATFSSASALALSLNFAAGVFAMDGKTYGQLSDLPGYSFTRASPGMAQRKDGSWQTFAAGVPRVTDQGFLSEEARTNSNPNNTFVGIAAGTPGVNPTGSGWSSLVAGLSSTISPVSSEFGLNYYDIRIFGTAGANGSNDYSLCAASAIPALVGQVWTGSFMFRMVSGSTNGLNGNVAVQMFERDSGGASLASASGTGAPLINNGVVQRPSYTRTLNQATTAFVSFKLTTPGVVNGAAIDITIRIYVGAQMEQALNVSSPILTTNAAVTRNEDVLQFGGRSLSTASMSMAVDVQGIYPGNTAYTARAFDIADATTQLDICSANSAGNVQVIGSGLTSTLLGSSGTWRAALSLSGGNVRATSNGLPVLAIAGPSTLNAVATFYRIGNNTGTRALNGYVKRAAIWSRALADSELLKEAA